MTSPSRGTLYGLIVCYITAFAMMIGTVFYANYISRHVNEESNRKWCELITPLDDAYNEGAVPQTALGKQVADAVHNIRLDFKC